MGTRSIPARAGEARGPRRADARQRSIPARAGETRFPSTRHGRTGPSPRVRGKLCSHASERCGPGSIPARAGEAVEQAFHSSPFPVHPRACGGSIVAWSLSENGWVHPRACGGSGDGNLTTTRKQGPSPRVRGKPARRPPPGRASGSIPARAGEAASVPGAASGSRVHPRACGGSIPALAQEAEVRGPSPRVRGKHRVGGPPGQRERSIPARAGEADRRSRTRQGGRVHPRACGGNRTLLRRWWSGSIPARAGEAGALPPTLHGPPVHPRACGGSAPFFTTQIPWPGPSPRVRGKRSLGSVARGSPGSIPARAGEALEADLQEDADGVHPRACGGSRNIFGPAAPMDGPSPRVRGKRLHGAEGS